MSGPSQAALPKPYRGPPDTALRQQRMVGWNPILHPVYVIISLLALGIIFIPTGVVLQNKSNEIVELSLEYDTYAKPSSDVPCGIGSQANANKACVMSFTAPEDMKAPIMIYYQLTNFHQNHRRFIDSRDELQLAGELTHRQSSFSKSSKCRPLHQLGNITLNPCGMFANTFFNDVITLVNVTDSDTGERLEDVEMLEDGIAWQSELEHRFHQPEGFRSEQCTSCDDDECSCDGEEWSCKTPWMDPKDGSCHKYFYPDDDSVQYLYETYPMLINPIEGVTNEHFIVWMRTATLPTFRKLYGYIQEPIPKGTQLTFQVNANYEVQRFSGTKTLIVTTSNQFGGKNDYFGQAFLIVGIGNMIVAFLFALKHWLAPRKLGDVKYLRPKDE